MAKSEASSKGSAGAAATSQTTSNRTASSAASTMRDSKAPTQGESAAASALTQASMKRKGTGIDRPQVDSPSRANDGSHVADVAPTQRRTHVPVAEAIGQLQALVGEVSTGVEITLTENGLPVARLVPAVPGPSPLPFDRERAQRAADGLRALSQRLTLGGLSTKDLINEGRR